MPYNSTHRAPTPKGGERKGKMVSMQAMGRFGKRKGRRSRRK